MATLRTTGSHRRQQVALHCHQHVWHCPVTAGDTCGSTLSPKGTRMAPYCHCRGHRDVSVCKRCCCILQSRVRSSYQWGNRGTGEPRCTKYIEGHLPPSPEAAEGQLNENTAI